MSAVKQQQASLNWQLPGRVKAECHPRPGSRLPCYWFLAERLSEADGSACVGQPRTGSLEGSIVCTRKLLDVHGQQKMLKRPVAKVERSSSVIPLSMTYSTQSTNLPFCWNGANKRQAQDPNRNYTLRYDSSAAVLLFI